MLNVTGPSQDVLGRKDREGCGRRGRACCRRSRWRHHPASFLTGWCCLYSCHHSCHSSWLLQISLVILLDWGTGLVSVRFHRMCVNAMEVLCTLTFSFMLECLPIAGKIESLPIIWQPLRPFARGVNEHSMHQQRAFWQLAHRRQRR